MEHPTKAALTLHIETGKGRVLHQEFKSHAELFDFVTQYILGDSAFDCLDKLIIHTSDEWATRGQHYAGPPAHELWKDAAEVE
jgi:hypothetical protein